MNELQKLAAGLQGVRPAGRQFAPQGGGLAMPRTTTGNALDVIRQSKAYQQASAPLKAAAAKQINNRVFDLARQAAIADDMAQGGSVSSGDRFRNISPAAQPPEVGKGGILRTTTPAVAAALAAGNVVTATISDATRARLTNTVIEYIEVVASGDLNDPDELVNIVVTLTINSRPIAACFEVPADLFSGDLNGPQLLPIGEFVGSDADIEVSFEVVTTLTTANAATIGVRIWSGDGSGSSLRR